MTGCLLSVVLLTVGVDPVGCLLTEGFGATVLGSGYLGTPLFGAFTVGVVPAGCFVAVARLTSAGRPALGCIEVVFRLGCGVVAASDSLGLLFRTTTLLFKADPFASEGMTDPLFPMVGVVAVGTAAFRIE